MTQAKLEPPISAGAATHGVSPQRNPARQPLATVESQLDLERAGECMHAFATELFPICRSITGDGIRETLRRIGERIPLDIHEVPTGTKVFDWTIPLEWRIRDAWVKNARGEKVIDFANSNLHVVNYSRPVHATMALAELKPHLHTLPDKPEWVPYRTSYYKESWGFCLSHTQWRGLEDGDYEVYIDSELVPGSLSYGECLVPGASSEEVLVSCHSCHPSLANDNLSGVVLATALAEVLRGAALRYSYRFLFIPGCIGAITWLARNESATRRIKHGLVVACVGDRGPFHYKRSRRGDAEIDRAAMVALQHRGEGHEVLDFSPYGYDERQYCSPGFDLAVGSLTRTPHGRFPQYHTSADNLEFIRPDGLAGSLAAYLSVVSILEHNRAYWNLNPKCEPQLGRRGLYRAMGGLPDAGKIELAMLWVLNLSDGRHDLLAIAERSGLPFDAIAQAARTLEEHELLTAAPGDD